MVFPNPSEYLSFFNVRHRALLAKPSPTYRWQATQTPRSVTLLAHRQLPDRFSFYGVFDGHCGSEAASFCVENMPRLLVESPQFPETPHRALVEAFAATDTMFNKTVRRRVF